MKVKWAKRALQAHQGRARVGRVCARLAGDPIGDVSLAVPVITAEQLKRIKWLHDRMEMLRAEMDQLAENLNASLAVLRGENHPEGWAHVWR